MCKKLLEETRKECSLLLWLVRLSWLGVVMKRRVTGSIPYQGTCLGCRFVCSQGVFKGQVIMCFFLASVFLSLSPPPKKK